MLFIFICYDLRAEAFHTEVRIAVNLRRAHDEFSVTAGKGDQVTDGRDASLIPPNKARTGRPVRIELGGSLLLGRSGVAESVHGFALPGLGEVAAAGADGEALVAGRVGFDVDLAVAAKAGSPG